MAHRVHCARRTRLEDALADWRVLSSATNATTARQQLRDCARAASAAWPQLLQSWSWAEVNQHDAIRRLLLRAVAWANDVGENNTPVDVRIAQDLIAQIDRTIWPEMAVPMRQLIRRCAELALSLATLQPPPKISEFDLYKISDGARILLTVRAAERACLLLPKRGVTHAHRAALRAAIDWARSIGEGQLKLEEGAERPFLQAIAALHWPGRSAHIADGVASCLGTASSPWIQEMSQARFEHLVASVDLQPAVLAGVDEANIGRDYLELRRLDIRLV
jgi:hypothetical protein